jgi:hypothetical protein
MPWSSQRLAAGHARVDHVEVDDDGREEDRDRDKTVGAGIVQASGDDAELAADEHEKRDRVDVPGLVFRNALHLGVGVEVREAMKHASSAK